MCMRPPRTLGRPLNQVREGLAGGGSHRVVCALPMHWQHQHSLGFKSQLAGMMTLDHDTVVPVSYE
jgi:hypothetical protein